jgi:hypothetical protein
MATASQNTFSYTLNDMRDCYIRVAIGNLNEIIYMNNLPDISDSHDAVYNDQNGPGRSMPIKTFGNGGPRVITWTITFISETEQKAAENVRKMRILQSCTYPRTITSNTMPYTPPPVLKIRCGELLRSGLFGSEDIELCVVLKSYSVKYPKDVPWQEYMDVPGGGRSFSYIPYKFDLALTFEAVYSTDDMPGQERIAIYGG